MQLFASIIILSAMYALLGVGFITIYKASRVLNFAYADLALVIAYLSVTLTTSIGGPVILPLALAVIMSFILGLLVYRVLIKPMIGESLLATIILTVALGIIFNAIAILIWQGGLETLSLGWRGYFRLSGGISISTTEIITILCAIILFLGLSSLYKFSKIGRQMRATAENILLSAQRGINIFFIMGTSWGIGVFVTGWPGFSLERIMV